MFSNESVEDKKELDIGEDEADDQPVAKDNDEVAVEDEDDNDDDRLEDDEEDEEMMPADNHENVEIDIDIMGAHLDQQVLLLNLFKLIRSNIDSR